MRDGPSNQGKPIEPSSSVSRRALLAWTATLAGGAALAASGLAQPALAADDEIVLTGAASEVGAKPSSAYSQGAAAFAGADSEIGGITAGAANVAVAPSGSGGGGGTGSGPGNSSGEGPGGGGGGGGGAGPGDSSGAGPGNSTGTGGGGRGGGTGSGPGDSSGAGPGDQSGGGY